MDAITFVVNYPPYIETIKTVTKVEYLPILDKMGQWDPHDLVQPDLWFQSENDALGFAFKLFLIEVWKSE
jgi:hypothetical protein